jgi:hypothetical protein
LANEPGQLNEGSFYRVYLFSGLTLDQMRACTILRFVMTALLASKADDTRTESIFAKQALKADKHIYQR